MTTRLAKRFGLALLPCLTLLAFTTASADAQTTLINDTFDNYVLVPTRLNDEDDPADADWWAVGRRMTPADSVLSLLTDDFGIASGYCLRVDKGLGSYPTEKNETRVLVNLPGYDSANEAADNVVLDQVDEYLQLTFTLRIDTITGDRGGGFRFGVYSKDSLYSTTVDPVLDYTGTSTNYLGEMNGYMVSMPVGADGNPNTGSDTTPHTCSTTRETNNGTIISPDQADIDNYRYVETANTYELDNAVHTIRYRLTRTDTGAMSAGMKTTLWVDDMVNPLLEATDDGTLSDPLAATDPYGFLSSFDCFVIGNRTGSGTEGATNFLLDNISVEASLNPPADIPGDTDSDGDVDADDLATVAMHWGSTDATGPEQGDFNDDGHVNAADAALLAANWHYGWVAPPESNSGAVPEPGSLTLLLGAVLTACLIRRRENG